MKMNIVVSRCCADCEGDEGYVQGMSDLCAPIYVVLGADEEMTFWCFVEVMNRMVRCFSPILCALGAARNLPALHSVPLEAELLARSERNEEAVAHITAANQHDGPRAVSSSR